MANTVPDGIWYPDEDTTIVKLDQMFATQASSIANGIGVRVANLEKSATMLATLTPGSTSAMTIGVGKIIPFTQPGAPAFNNGITLNANGSVSVTQRGIYFCSFGLLAGTNALVTSNPRGYIQAGLRKNNAYFTTALGLYADSGSPNPVAPVAGSGSAVCVPGDTLDVYATISGMTSSLYLSAGSASSPYCTFSVVQLKAY